MYCFYIVKFNKMLKRSLDFQKIKKLTTNKNKFIAFCSVTSIVAMNRLCTNCDAG